MINKITGNKDCSVYAGKRALINIYLHKYLAIIHCFECSVKTKISEGKDGCCITLKRNFILSSLTQQIDESSPLVLTSPCKSHTLRGYLPFIYTS